MALSTYNADLAPFQEDAPLVWFWPLYLTGRMLRPEYPSWKARPERGGRSLWCEAEEERLPVVPLGWPYRRILTRVPTSRSIPNPFLSVFLHVRIPLNVTLLLLACSPVLHVSSKPTQPNPSVRDNASSWTPPGLLPFPSCLCQLRDVVTGENAMSAQLDGASPQYTRHTDIRRVPSGAGFTWMPCNRVH